jgi:hypothetical protein
MRQAQDDGGGGMTNLQDACAPSSCYPGEETPVLPGDSSAET